MRLKRLCLIVILFLFLFIVESVALYNVKKYSITSEKRSFMTSLLFYTLVPFFILYLLRMSLDLGKTNLIWNVASSIYGVLIGVILFSEVIRGTQWIGVLFALMGIALISLGDFS